MRGIIFLCLLLVPFFGDSQNFYKQIYVGLNISRDSLIVTNNSDGNMFIDFNDSQIILKSKNKLTLPISTNDGIYPMSARVYMDTTDTTSVYYFFEIVADTQTGKRNITIR